MKILIATESYYPNISGVAVFSHQLAKKMVQRGHRVFVIAPSPKYAAFTEKIDGIAIYRLKSKNNPFRQGYFISRFPFFKVAKLIRKIQPDVIHLQDPAAICLATLMAARRRKIPVVATNHFSLEYVISYLPFLKVFHFLLLKILLWYLGLFYNRCRMLTFPTKTVVQFFAKKHLKAKSTVISNGVDLSRFMPYYGGREIIKRKYKIPLKKPIVLYVGRLDVDKRTEILIRAFAQAVSSVEAHLVIIGDGTTKKSLIDLATALKIKDNVSFLGAIAHENADLPKLYQAADIFVNPCPIETQSIVVLEAAATGLPILAADGGALPEMVKNGQNGYLFDPNNPEILAEQLIKLIKDRPLRTKMGKTGLELVENQKVEKTYKEFEKIYRELKNEVV